MQRQSRRITPSAIPRRPGALAKESQNSQRRLISVQVRALHDRAGIATGPFTKWPRERAFSSQRRRL